MKINLKRFILFNFKFFIITNPYSEEIIRFNVSEIEITQDGNLLKDLKEERLLLTMESQLSKRI